MPKPKEKMSLRERMKNRTKQIDELSGFGGSGVLSDKEREILKKKKEKLLAKGAKYE